MPYPTGHREQIRKNIIDSARRLFNLKGFDGVPIAAIMRGAGLTHGGFYSYFQSKSDLYREAMNCFFTDPEWKNCWEGVQVDLSATDVGAQIVNAYLSRQHFEDVENSCPMVALPTDVARSDEATRQAFETVFRAMVSVLERSLRGDRAYARVRARAIAALSIGGMVVARAIVDRAHADALRRSCLEVALELGGWKSSRSTKLLHRRVKTRRSERGKRKRE
jgi:TetR/AcrR family transcriptional regulator, transcriptional repressor for nem operon